MLMSSVLQKKCFLKMTAVRIKCKIFCYQPGRSNRLHSILIMSMCICCYALLSVSQTTLYNKKLKLFGKSGMQSWE